jgi:hypothetical protein
MLLSPLGFDEAFAVTALIVADHNQLIRRLKLL